MPLTCSIATCCRHAQHVDHDNADADDDAKHDNDCDDGDEDDDDNASGDFNAEDDDADAGEYVDEDDDYVAQGVMVLRRGRAVVHQNSHRGMTKLSSAAAKDRAGKFSQSVGASAHRNCDGLSLGAVPFSQTERQPQTKPQQRNTTQKGSVEGCIDCTVGRCALLRPMGSGSLLAGRHAQRATALCVSVAMA